MKYLKTFIPCFLAILAVELIVVSSADLPPYRIITKPLVVGSLLVYFLLQKVERKTKVLVTSALIFSIIGDIQLIYAGKYEYLFVGGLMAFLFAHVLYIIEFSRTRNRKAGVLAPLSILLIYAIAIFWYLSDALENMMLPVGIYIITILIMILFAYLRDDSMTDNGYIYVVSGALLFMLSDSIIGITRFKSDIPYSRILVMAIYGFAQLLMVLGILMGEKAKAQKVY